MKLPDISSDTSHMNRLERGAYFDILQALKKKRKLTEQEIKDLLGKDFEKCWPRLRLALTRNDKEEYYIGWLEMILKKEENYAKSRGANAKGKIQANEQAESIAGTTIVGSMAAHWKKIFPRYASFQSDDYPALLDFADFICSQLNIKLDTEDNECKRAILNKWVPMCKVILGYLSWSKKSLKSLAKFNKQEIYSQIDEIDRGDTKRMVI